MGVGVAFSEEVREVGHNPEALMGVLEEIVAHGMPEMEAKYMALALNAAVEGRSASYALVREAMRRY